MKWGQSIQAAVLLRSSYSGLLVRSINLSAYSGHGTPKYFLRTLMPDTQIGTSFLGLNNSLVISDILQTIECVVQTLLQLRTVC